ncbi:MAG: pyridoxal-dependent decarboxylase [Ilumatobacteraceae bacterium]
MHRWDEATDLLAHAVIGYAIERLKTSKDPTWGARPAEQLAVALDGVIGPDGIGGHQALALFRDVLMHACRPMDSPMHLAYVATAPTPAANMFDLVVSASSIFGGLWEGGAGAIAAENQTLAWLADLAGFPEGAGGCFVSGGSAANLSALVTARHRAREIHGSPAGRWRFATTAETHASVHAAARVMDVDVVLVAPDERGRMTGAALRAALDDAGTDGVFAVVANFGTTNVGAVDELDAVAAVCADHDLWLHIDAAYGGAALCAPSTARLRQGFERADSFGIDPHKWLFAPYDCAALVYRQPALASAAHAQHGTYLDMVSRDEWNPSDFAFHLSRRARGLPLWFSLATHGTDAYADAVESTLDVARRFAVEVDRRDGFQLVLDPQLSVVLFTVDGWDEARYVAWSQSRARAGVALVVPTRWHDEWCYRVCLVNPQTTDEMLTSLLDDMAAYRPGPTTTTGSL